LIVVTQEWLAALHDVALERRLAVNPTHSETEDFLKSASVAKRAELIDKLLASEATAS